MLNRYICNVILGLFCLCQARGNTIPSGLVAGREPDILPPADYSFFEFSQVPQWTNGHNQALTGNLLNLLTTLGGDDSQIGLLFQPGAVFGHPALPKGARAESPLVAQLAGNSLSPVYSPQGSSQRSSQPSSVPEPATLGVLAGSLVLLSFYAMYCARKIELDESLQRIDQPPGD